MATTITNAPGIFDVTSSSGVSPNAHMTSDSPSTGIAPISAETSSPRAVTTDSTFTGSTGISTTPIAPNSAETSSPGGVTTDSTLTGSTGISTTPIAPNSAETSSPGGVTTDSTFTGSTGISTTPIAPNSAETSSSRGVTTDSTFTGSTEISTTPIAPNSSETSSSRGVTTDSTFTGSTGISTMPTTQIANITLMCAEPPSFIGGSIISRGPYVANVSSAVFTCYAGYTMNGVGQVMCNAAGLWASKLPQCVPINNNPNVDNNMTFNQDAPSVPWWLLIVLAVTLGILCLLLLTCALFFCLKMFGCWKGGSCFGSKVKSTERIHDTETYVDDFGPRDTYRARREYYEDDESTPRPKRSKQADTPASQRVRGWEMYKNRREAKMPPKLTWMPHSNNVRNFNTSTK